MIQVNELRLGNKILLYGSKHTVTADDISYCDENTCIDEWSGIPFTPEILEKCGFVNNPSWMHLELSDLLILYHRKGDAWCSLFTNNECVADEFIIQLPFLHQLQNLYYALTVQELTVNL